jgi:hypothetical protein
LHGPIEVIRELPGVRRVGSRFTHPGQRHPVYLIIRPSRQGYLLTLASFSCAIMARHLRSCCQRRAI